MKDIIINQPHLQSFQQKCGSAFVIVLSWLLWIYFLTPLFTLGGWLMGVKGLSDEIRWFGGYKTLIQLLQMYGAIILLIGVIWLLWTFFISWQHRHAAKLTQTPVSDQQLATKFKIELRQLHASRGKNKLTVHFDEHALITSINDDSTADTPI